MLTNLLFYTKSKVESNSYFALWGDSICDGRGDTYGPTPIEGKMKEWNGVALANVTSTDMIGAQIGSFGPQFGIDYNLKNNTIVNVSHDGSGGSEFSPYLDTNNWSTSGDLYEPAKDAALAMLTFAGVSKIDGILLILGINDARGTTSYATIQADMQSLVDRINTDFDTPNIYLSKIGTSEAGDTQRVLDVRGFQDDLAANNANVGMAYEDQPTFTVGNGLLKADNLHPTQDGNNLIGAGFSDFIN